MEIFAKIVAGISCAQRHYSSYLFYHRQNSHYHFSYHESSRLPKTLAFHYTVSICDKPAIYSTQQAIYSTLFNSTSFPRKKHFLKKISINLARDENKYRKGNRPYSYFKQQHIMSCFLCYFRKTIKISL